MDISFDPVKSIQNAIKHGVALEQAASIEWDDAVMWQDNRRAYDEIRIIALGYIGLRLHVVCFTDRGDTRRIISLRKANLRETQRYAST